MKDIKEYSWFISRKIFALLSADAGSFLIMALLVIVYGRISGPELLGVFSLSFALATAFRTFTELGYDLEIPRNVNTASESPAEIIYNIQKTKNTLWLIFLPISIVFGYFLVRDWAFLVLIFWNFFLGISSTYKAFLRGIQRVAIIPKIEIIFSALFTSIGLLIIFFYNNLFIIFTVLLAVEFLKIVTYSFYSEIRRKKLGNILRLFAFGSSTVFSNAGYQEIKKQFSLFAVNMFTMLQYRVVTFTLGFMGTNLQLGIYSAATRFLTIARILPLAILNALLPEFAKPEYSSKPQKLYFLSFISLLIGLSFAIVVYFSSELLIVGIFGEEFRSSVIILQILAWTFIPTMLNYTLEPFLLANNKENYVNKVMILSTITIGLISVLILSFSDFYKLPYAVLIGDLVMTISYIIFIFRITRKSNY